MLKFRTSAFKHGITKEKMEEVLANRLNMTKWFPIHEDEYDNSQDIAVGFDAEGSLLEVGVTYLEDDEIVFHADRASKIWINKYTEV